MKKVYESSLSILSVTHKWGSGSFVFYVFYLLIRVILRECRSIRDHSRDVTTFSTSNKRIDRGKTSKHPFQTDTVASSWLN